MEDKTHKTWREHFEAMAAYDYTRAHEQKEDDAKYIQSVSAHSRVYGMNDYKSALRSHLEQSIINEKHVLDNPTEYHYNDVEGARKIYDTVKNVIKLLDTVLPHSKA